MPLQQVTISGRRKIAEARRERLIRQIRREAIRKARLAQRDRRLAEQWLVHKLRMAKRQQRLDAAHRERQRRHWATMAKRRSKSA